MIRMRMWIGAVCFGVALQGCAVGHLAGYVIDPDAPTVRGGETFAVPQLQQPVTVRQTPDGLWHVQAQSETDGLRVLGYLMARDRMFQMDLFRHLARGRLAALIGDAPLGKRTALDQDRMNRFLGLEAQADALLAQASPAERAALQAFADGVNGWLRTGQRTLEHRLLGFEAAEIRPWHPSDSAAIYAMLAFGLAGNANREIRRLMLACDAGVDGMQRIWPTMIDADASSLPPEEWPSERSKPVPGVVPDVSKVLPNLCPDPPADASGRREAAAAEPAMAWLQRTWVASNNWVVSGSHTASGKPLVANDPHLPLMSPPLLWGFELQTDEIHVAGFTITGLHRVVFGHNGYVAWGQTTNHVDRQDLYLLKSRPATDANGKAVPGYAWDGGSEPFRVKTARFDVRGGKAVTQSVRFSRHGPVYNDLDPLAGPYAPLVALKSIGAGQHGDDLDGARALGAARNVTEAAAAIARIDGNCSNWVMGDRAGNIAYRSPCRIPQRRGWRGTFPVPGWLPEYAWGPLMSQDRLPQSTNPKRGWLGTANSRIVPVSRMPVPWVNDPSPVDRLRRMETLLGDGPLRAHRFTQEQSGSMQTDLGLSGWAAIRARLERPVCVSPPDGKEAVWRQARQVLCDWNGFADAGSAGMTVFVLLTHAVLDQALADELRQGADGHVWWYVQNLLQFEANVQRLWREPATAAVWDDVRTDSVETAPEILAAAFDTAVDDLVERWGADPDGWAWGMVRPFVLKHMFAQKGGLLGHVFNPPAVAGAGDVTTLYKFHYPRADRDGMETKVGPPVRLNIDLAEPWGATYTYAGGQSGWPLSEHYGDLLEDWRWGRARPLTPAPTAADKYIKFVPGTVAP